MSKIHENLLEFPPPREIYEIILANFDLLLNDNGGCG